MATVVLTQEECHALYQLIAELSGCSPEYVFSWKGDDSLDDPRVSACAKIYLAAGKNVPENLKVEVSPCS